ncbi:MAG TPA: serine hydrolase domain-containing protein [Acidimicrobiia bacterium]|nr:serine hydrolase domain-containing protein [Acidimicrobiia bacterium]
MPEPDLSPVVELLERQRAEDLHDCAQAYVSLQGTVLLDTAVGQSRPGRDLRVDDLMLWYSSSKPVTTVALLQLWEQGRLALDDPVAKYVDGWGAGKERATLRHVLTHTGGFPMLTGGETFDLDAPYDGAVARIAAHEAEWVPGTAAGYHASSGWKILGAVVEAVDGRPIARFARDEIFTPVGMANCRMGVSLDEQRALGDRIAPVAWKGHSVPRVRDGALQMIPYKVDRIHNEPWHVAKVEPGGGIRGPARELGLFYEAVLGYGAHVLDDRTVEVMAAIHRRGMKDVTFGLSMPWGLGVQRAFTGGTTRRAFGHSGMASSRGLADPEIGLVMVVVCNGLPSYLPNEQRFLDITDAVYSALGEEVALLRQELRPIVPGVLST